MSQVTEFFNLHLNSHTWLVTIVLESTVLETDMEIKDSSQGISAMILIKVARMRT